MPESWLSFFSISVCDHYFVERWRWGDLAARKWINMFDLHEYVQYVCVWDGGDDGAGLDVEWKHVWQNTLEETPTLFHRLMHTI